MGLRSLKNPPRSLRRFGGCYPPEGKFLAPLISSLNRITILDLPSSIAEDDEPSAPRYKWIKDKGGNTTTEILPRRLWILLQRSRESIDLVIVTPE